MPPAVIDLTSSPEPDGSPKTSLQNWRPRKKREKDSASGRVDRGRDNEASHSSRVGRSTPSDLLSKNDKNRSLLHDIHRGSKPPRSSRISSKPTHARSQWLEASEKDVRLALNRPQEGSLASLLQRNAQESFKLPASKQPTFANGRKNESSPYKSSLQSSPGDVEAERVQVLSKFQAHRAGITKPRPPPGIALGAKMANEQTPSKSSNSAPTPPTAKFDRREPIKIVDENGNEGRSNQANASNLGVQVDDDSDRPTKRRRLDEATAKPVEHFDRGTIDCADSLRFTGVRDTFAGRSTLVDVPIRSASPASNTAKQWTPAPKTYTSAAQRSNESPNVSRSLSVDNKQRQHSSANAPNKVEAPSFFTSKDDRTRLFVPLSDEKSGTIRFSNNFVEKQASITSPQQAVGKLDARVSVEQKSRLGTGLPLERSSASGSTPSYGRAAKAPNTFQTGNVKVGGAPYTDEEDALLTKLKEVDKLSWEEIARYFVASRSRGSLQVRYSTTLSKRKLPSKAAEDTRSALRQRPELGQEAVQSSESTESEYATRPIRKKRNNDISATDGFISWAEVKKRRAFGGSQLTIQNEESDGEQRVDGPQFAGERAHLRSLQRIIRQRESAINTPRSWSSMRKSIPDELKERTLDNIGPAKYYKGTSGDVTCLAWAPNGESFAAGSIAITDERSMQYNRSNNLLLGWYERNVLQELPEHHIQRPMINSESGNANGLHAMRETQDPRLFMTVASVQFSPSSNRLYSAGSDHKVRAYRVRGNDVSHLYELNHNAPLDLLSVNSVDVLATACHQSTDKSIAVFKGQNRVLELSPDRKDEQTTRAIYPSALRWGSAYQNAHYLLAGFCIDSTDDERYIAGETCLWNVQQETRIAIHGITRNVFDVAWNPSPSAGSSIFAIASSRGTGSTSRGTRSVVQCFGANTKRTIGWECPAFDINDVIYCKHDDNFIAAGATDGKIYIWDQRFADRNSRPLHVLEHGDTLNVLDHDQERELADTGVRFISWGATSSRLYTGSSDGVVKVWNPYRSTKEAHVKDVAFFNSAIMSGAFSPDDRELLIGEDQGQLNLLSIGYEHKAVRSMQRWELQPSPTPKAQEDRLGAARSLMASGQMSFKQMGDLPMRQAVQGPKYCGPYLKPSADEMAKANNEYESTLDAQHLADLSSSSAGEPNEALQQATKRVKDAQDQLLHLQRRLDDSISLEPAAIETQQRFLRAEKARADGALYGVKPCKLDCTYLPITVDDNEEVPDSRRSEVRIPGVLRSLHPLTNPNRATEETSDHRENVDCISCRGPAPVPSQGKQASCEKCTWTRNGLTTSCELCSNPVRPSASSSDPGLCEKCSFECLRCGKASIIAREVTLVTCERCKLTWRVGVLGYELLNEASTTRPGTQRRLGNEMISERESLGDAELEHYASIWQTGVGVK